MELFQNRSGKLDLIARVKMFLAGQHFGGLRQIEVEADGGIVILNGIVSSFYERQMAVACCKRVHGVLAVDDRLQVGGKDSVAAVST